MRCPAVRPHPRTHQRPAHRPDYNVFLVLGAWPAAWFSLCFLEQSPRLDSLSALYTVTSGLWTWRLETRPKAAYHNQRGDVPPAECITSPALAPKLKAPRVLDTAPPTPTLQYSASLSWGGARDFDGGDEHTHQTWPVVCMWSLAGGGSQDTVVPHPRG